MEYTKQTENFKVIKKYLQSLRVIFEKNAHQLGSDAMKEAPKFSVHSIFFDISNGKDVHYRLSLIKDAEVFIAKYLAEELLERPAGISELMKEYGIEEKNKTKGDLS